MRGDKKRLYLVLLIVATLFATLGLTSLAGMENPSPAAVAAPAAMPLPAPNPSDASSLPPASDTSPPPASPIPAPPPALAPSSAPIPVSYQDGPSADNPNDIPEINRKKPLKFTLDEELRGSGAVAPANGGADAPANPRATGPQSVPYEVTAYFLNVRANPYNGSKVIRVVKQGSRLEVIGRTDKGWLRLKDGGYVHGGYAKPLGEDAGFLQATSSTSPPAKPPAVHKQLEAPPKEEKSDPGVQAEDSDPASPTNRVNTDSGLTEAHIAKLFEGTALAGHGIEDVVLEIEDEYGINALFTIAVMKLESGNGKSKLSRTKNNLFGLNATSGDKNNKAFSFKTKGDSVRKFGQLLADKYVDKGLTTVDKVAGKYCPASSSWAGKVMGIMKSDYRKL